jgi:hypothetical protein
MLATKYPGFRRSLAAFALLLGGVLMAGAASAQAPREDSLEWFERVRRMNEVAAQKMETDVRDAIATAQRLQGTDPAAAAARLRDTLAVLEEDTTLPTERRVKLVRQVKERLRAAEANRSSDREDSRLAAAARHAEDERRAAENQQISRSLATVRSLQRDGRSDEAKRLADELTRRYPNNVAAQAARHNTTANDVAGAWRRDTADYNARVAAVSRDINQSALPSYGEVEFPKNWTERTAKRSTGLKLTDKEKAIMRGLSTPVSLDLKDAHFEDVIHQLENAIGQTIELDPAAMQEAQVNYDTPVAVKFARPVAARTILRSVLSGLNMAYVIRDQSIQVTTALKAKDMMVTRSYYIGDLIGNGMAQAPLSAIPLVVQNNPFLPGIPVIQPASPLAMQAANAASANQLAAQIIQMIKESVDPRSWESEGPSITYHPQTMSLVIRQSAEVHAMLAGSVAR